MSMRVALVGGPMYDGIYRMLPGDCEVVVHADHPTLNRAVADLLSQGERLDLISTHSKYAPSQAEWLHPLDSFVAPALVGRLAPGAVELCRSDGQLLCVPRSIDVRVLWYRADCLDRPPDRWDDLEATGLPFGFPGRESGLFGTFFELVVGAGGRLFSAAGQPTMDGPEAVAAVERLYRLAQRGPEDLPGWHYDEVDAALSSGRVAMAASWPGGFGALRASPFYDRLQPAPYPSGPSRRVTYAGCHAWAVPRTAAEPEASMAVIGQLCSPEAARLDADGGTVCADVATFASRQPADAKDALRLQLTRAAIEEAMITYPPLRRFPEIEDAGWGAIHDALLGRLTAAEAVARIQAVAREVLNGE